MAAQRVSIFAGRYAAGAAGNEISENKKKIPNGPPPNVKSASAASVDDDDNPYLEDTPYYISTQKGKTDSAEMVNTSKRLF